MELVDAADELSVDDDDPPVFVALEASDFDDESLPDDPESEPFDSEPFDSEPDESDDDDRFDPPRLSFL